MQLSSALAVAAGRASAAAAARMAMTLFLIRTVLLRVDAVETAAR
jgi:hypothetical protein